MGENSSKTLRKLPGYLKTFNPNIVIMMTGLDNRWNLDGSNYLLFRKGIKAEFYRIDAYLSRLRCYKLFKVLVLSIRNKSSYNRPVQYKMSKKIVTARKENSQVDLINTEIYEKAEAFFESGTKYLEIMEFSRAMQEFKKAIDIKPDYNSVLLNLADAYDCQGK